MFQGSSIVAALLSVLGAVLLLRTSPVPNPEEPYKRALAHFREGDYLGAASLAHKGWQNRPPSEWFWRFRLLEAESSMEGGSVKAGIELLKVDSQVTTPEFEIGRRVLTDMRNARLLNDRKDYAAAAKLWEQARRLAHASGDQYREAASSNGLGMMWFLQSRCDQAIPLFDQALRLWRETGARYKAATAGNNIAMCYANLGDFDKADQYRNDALPLMRPGGLLADTLGQKGNAYVLQGLSDQAIPLFRRACDMARQFGAREKAARWASNLSQALSDAGDWEGAEQARREAIDLGPEERSRIYLDLNAAPIAAGRNRLPEAQAIYKKAIAAAQDNPAVKWEAYAGLAKIAGGDIELANRYFEDAIRVIEESQSDLRGSDNKITFLSRLIRFYQDYVDALITQNQSIKALAVADGSRARVLSQRFGQNLPASTPHQEADFKAIARQSGGIWLSYWLAPNRSFLWVTTPEKTCFFQLGASSTEIASLVEEYRGFVENMRDPLQRENEAGDRLYKILIAPVAQMIPPGSPVFVVPDGALHRLSFETLPVYDGAHPHYWVKDATVSVAPSFGVFLGKRQRPGGARKSLIVGDAPSPGPAFPRLEYADTEIASVAKYLGDGVTKIVHEDARPEVWQQADPGRYDVIHFAAHAEANRLSPLDSAIILSGENFRLFARNIIGLKLRADLVTLSACRSSGARTYAGEGLVGLTWAFLQAGSRNVVAGLWDVADESTSLLMDQFYAAIAKGADPADALRSAQLYLLNTDYSKPYYWGPFQCYRR